MNTKTYSRRYNSLLRDISIHPHKEEILKLMYQQLQDDESISARIELPSKL